MTKKVFIGQWPRELKNQYLPSILIPRLDLSVAQSQLVRQFHAILHAEIFLSLERLLECLKLMIREGSAGLSLLFAQSRRPIQTVLQTPLVVFVT
jgi:hypothetical protein